MKYAKEIKSARIRAGMTQRQAAEKLGISKSQVERIERGKATPRPLVAAAYLKSLYGQEVAP